MARIRYLKPDFFLDTELAKLPYHVRLFYAGMWCQADKAGRLRDDPMLLKATIMPYDKVDPEKCLQSLAKPKPRSGRPFIYRYIIDGVGFIQILSWSDHQRPHHTEAESKIPPHPPMGKGMEKGMENQLEASLTLENGSLTVKEEESSISANEEAFEAARKLYPGKKRGKETEFSDFRKKHKDWKECVQYLEPAIRILIAEREKLLKEKRFVPEWKHFKTWLYNRCWEEALNADI